MIYYLLFALLGYLLGSILFARIWGMVISKKDITAGTKDGNPGTANAFTQGGFVCGALTIICELLKGFLPVFLCQWFRKYNWFGCEDMHEYFKVLGLALVIYAPVFGHVIPLYFHGRGGKGIAVTFGSLLGFFPDLGPALVLAFFFILFSLVIRISPHFYRTIGTYLFAAVALCFGKFALAVKIGFAAITMLVMWKMHSSEEERERCKVSLLWIR